MDTQQALLRAILLNPDDDAARLVYADWLQENGGTVPCKSCSGKGNVEWMECDIWAVANREIQSAPCPTCNGTGTASDARAERAEFVRLQIAAHSRGEIVGAMALWNLLHSSEHWFAEACKACRIDWDDWGVLPDESVHWEYKHHTNEFFARRGFVSEIRLPLTAFMEHTESLFSAHPITAVTLTDRVALGDGELDGGLYRVWYRDRTRLQSMWPNFAYYLPAPIFDQLKGGELVCATSRYTVYQQPAYADLSRACVTYGRSLAGLPPLPGTGAGSPE